MKLAFYRGTSWVSKAIRWQTRGRYSHVAIVLENGTVIESWHVGGVLHNASLGTRHEKGTMVDLYEIVGLDAETEQKIVDWLMSQLGKSYDFGSVFRFMSRREKDWSTDEWFCSELVMEAFAQAGFQLLKTEPHKVSPEVLAWSTRLNQISTVVTS